MEVCRRINLDADFFTDENDGENPINVASFFPFIAVRVKYYITKHFIISELPILDATHAFISFSWSECRLIDNNWSTNRLLAPYLYKADNSRQVLGSVAIIFKNQSNIDVLSLNLSRVKSEKSSVKYEPSLVTWDVYTCWFSLVSSTTDEVASRYKLYYSFDVEYRKVFPFQGGN